MRYKPKPNYKLYSTEAGELGELVDKEAQGYTPLAAHQQGDMRQAYAAVVQQALQHYANIIAMLIKAYSRQLAPAYAAAQPGEQARPKVNYDGRKAK